MVSLSLCMIVKNEEAFLRQCLNSVNKCVNEIIIVDTGSTDKTKKIAKGFTDKTYDFEWTDDFSDARNFSIKKATGDWILVLDADEVIAKESIKKILSTIKDTEHDSFYLIQRNYTNDKSRKNWVHIDSAKKTKKRYKESKKYDGFINNPNIRLFQNKNYIKFKGVVHSVVDKSVKNPGHLDAPIHHYYEEKKNNSLIERQTKYLEMAKKNFDKDKTGRAYYTAASISLYFKKDHKSAEKYFKKALQKGYNKNLSMEGLAQCYLEIKDYENSYQTYKKLIEEKYYTSSLCNNMANLLVMHKHYKPALKLLKKSLELGNPNKERILKNIKTLEKILKKD